MKAETMDSILEKILICLLWIFLHFHIKGADM